MATWCKAGRLDRWVKERQQWLGRVRGPDGRQRWIKLLIFVPRAAHRHDWARQNAFVAEMLTAIAATLAAYFWTHALCPRCS
jgi:SH3-like domain-containing protein